MRIRKLSLGLGIALGLAACTRTPMSVPGDAAVDVQPPSDLRLITDLAPSNSDAGPLVPDASVLVPDTAVVVPDTAVVVPDTAVVRRDTSVLVADTAVVRRDTSVLVPDTAVLRRDSAFAVADTVVMRPDSSLASPDTTGPAADSRETAPNPLADRTFRIDPANPAPTPDPSCTQYESVDMFLLTFSSDLASVAGLAVRGSAATKFHATAGPESDRLTYHTTDFLGGGRIFIEHDQGIYVGQVVVYGSGVPTAWCLRGVLTPQE